MSLLLSIPLPLLWSTMRHMHTRCHLIERMHPQMRGHSKWRRCHMSILLIISLKMHRMNMTTSKVLIHSLMRHILHKLMTFFFWSLILLTIIFLLFFIVAFSFFFWFSLIAIGWLILWRNLHSFRVLLDSLIEVARDWSLRNLTFKKFQILRILRTKWKRLWCRR